MVVVERDFRDLADWRVGDAFFLPLAGDLLDDLVLERLLDRDVDLLLFFFVVWK